MPSSRYDGLSQVTVNGDSNLVPNNIKSGINIFGITRNLLSADLKFATIPSPNFEYAYSYTSKVSFEEIDFSYDKCLSYCCKYEYYNPNTHQSITIGRRWIGNNTVEYVESSIGRSLFDGNSTFYGVTSIPTQYDFSGYFGVNLPNKTIELNIVYYYNFIGFSVINSLMTDANRPSNEVIKFYWYSA